MALSDEAIYKATRIVKTLAEIGLGDYSPLIDQIAYDVYETGFWQGNWDVNFDPSYYGYSLPSFRVIQEDEFDQQFMDADDIDAYYVGSAYIIL